MKIMALTGGIASGKTTVCDMFRDCGAAVINADHLAHRIYDPGEPVYQEILNRYGKKLLGPDKNIDRKKLAELLFGNPKEREWLESLIHPATRDLIGKKIQELIHQKPPLIIVEAALHLETGYYRYFQGLILVDVTDSVQKERLKNREKLTEKEITQRLKNQWPLKKKRPYADWVIDNSGTLAETKKQVEKIYRELIKNS